MPRPMQHPSRRKPRRGQYAKLEAILRWLAQLRAPDGKPSGLSPIRQIESAFDATCSDTNRMLRGVLVADHLVLTRHRSFYRLEPEGRLAHPVSPSFVSRHYNLAEIQRRYREVRDAWKTRRRKTA